MKMLVYTPLTPMAKSTLLTFVDSTCRLISSIHSYFDCKILFDKSLEHDPVHEMIPNDKKIFLDCSPGDIDHLILEISSALGSWKPDICFSLGRVKWLKGIFPKAMPCYFDSAFISRDPFPYSVTFDPLSIVSENIPSTFGEAMKQKKISKSKKDKIFAFKKEIRNFVRENNPLVSRLTQGTKKYSKKVLLALEGNTTWMKNECGVRTPFELFEHYINKIPSDVGVVLSQHPNYRPIHNDNIDKAIKKYSNLIYIPELERFPSSSLFVFDFVDAIVSLSSSARLQGAFIWNLPVISDSKLGINRMLHNAYSFDEFNEALENPTKDEDSILYWYLTHYTVLSESIRIAPKKLTNFIKNMYWRFCLLGPHSATIPQINSLSKLCDDVLAHLSKNNPWAPARDMKLKNLVSGYRPLSGSL